MSSRSRLAISVKCLGYSSSTFTSVTTRYLGTNRPSTRTKYSVKKPVASSAMHAKPSTPISTRETFRFTASSRASTSSSAQATPISSLPKERRRVLR